MARTASKATTPAAPEPDVDPLAGDDEFSGDTGSTGDSFALADHVGRFLLMVPSGTVTGVETKDYGTKDVEACHVIVAWDADDLDGESDMFEDAYVFSTALQGALRRTHRAGKSLLGVLVSRKSTTRAGASFYALDTATAEQIATARKWKAENPEYFDKL